MSNLPSDPTLEATRFSGNAKAFDKFRFLLAVEEEASQRFFKYTTITLFDTMDHLPDSLHKILYPDQHAIGVADALHASAVAAALNAEPPTPPPVRAVATSTAIARQPMPKAPPALPVGANAAKVREHERAIETFSDSLLAVKELRTWVLRHLDECDTETLRSSSPDGLARVTTKNIFSFIWSTYEMPSPDQIALRHSEITAKLDRSIHLLLNFQRRTILNEDLIRACPTQAYTSEALFIILFNLCKDPSTRLRPIVYRYTLVPGYVFATSKAEDFVKFMVDANLTHMHEVGTGHLAFAGEDGYTAARSHPLALATPSPPNLLPPPLALAAPVAPAVPAAPTGAPPRGPRVRPFGAPARVPGRVAPTGHPPGKICFVHGFQREHNSRSCPVMEANPTNYTPAQRSLVHFPSGSNPMIDGKLCNITCAPGVGPHP